jgi:hypothetical protein
MNTPQPPKGAWTIVLLLFLFMVIKQLAVKRDTRQSHLQAGR